MIRQNGEGSFEHRSCATAMGLLGWLKFAGLPLLRSPHAASDRLLFFASIPVGLYRAQIVPRDRRYLRSQSEPQARGAGRSVFRNRRPALDETPPGAAALPDGR